MLTLRYLARSLDVDKYLYDISWRQPMNDKFLAEDLRKIANLMEAIEEETPDAEAPAEPEAKPDKSVSDTMTHEKKPSKLTGSVQVKQLAQLLGIENTQLFTTAFTNLRMGRLPTSNAQVRELAIAFDKLLAADASTTGKVLNQLRRIHKAN